MFTLSLSVLLGWTEVVKTQSRTQSVLVCSLLVVSLLLPAAVGGEDATATSTSPTETTANMPSQLVTIVIAVVVSAVLILVVVGLVVAIVTVVLCRRWNKESTNRGVRSQRADDTLNSHTYYELMSPDVNHTHIHHQPHPLHAPHTNTTSDNGDHIAMQDCPAYQPIEDTPTSRECTKGYHISMQDCPAYQPIEDTPTSVTGDYTYIS